MKLRQNLIIFSFILGCIFLSALSYLGHFNDFGDEYSLAQMNKKTSDVVDDTFFKQVSYFSVVNNFPFLKLDSNELTASTLNGTVVAFNPTGVIYRDNIEETFEPIFFKSKTSTVYLKKQEFNLTNDVELKMGNISLSSNQMNIYNNGKKIIASNAVKTLSKVDKTGDQILINSDKAIYLPKENIAEYIGHVQGSVERKIKYEDSIKFTTGQMIFYVPLNQLELNDGVSISRGSYTAMANKGRVYLENYNKKLKYYSLSDDVRMEEKINLSSREMIRKAYAEKLDGVISEKKIILSGFPKVFQGKDTIKGNQIVIRENIETVEVDDANTSINLDKRE